MLSGRNLRCVLVGIALFFGVMASAEEVLEEAIGVVVATKGRAYIVSPSGESRPAKLQEVVRVKDTLRTKRDAFLQVTYIDGSYHQLSNGNEVRLDQYQYNPAEGEALAKVSAGSGFLTFFGGGIAEVAPEEYKVETVTTATIGIRGTTAALDGDVVGVNHGVATVDLGAGKAPVRLTRSDLLYDLGKAEDASPYKAKLFEKNQQAGDRLLARATSVSGFKAVESLSPELAATEHERLVKDTVLQVREEDEKRRARVKKEEEVRESEWSYPRPNSDGKDALDKARKVAGQNTGRAAENKEGDLKREKSGSAYQGPEKEYKERAGVRDTMDLLQERRRERARAKERAVSRGVTRVRWQEDQEEKRRLEAEASEAERRVEERRRATEEWVEARREEERKRAAERQREEQRQIERLEEEARREAEGLKDK